VTPDDLSERWLSLAEASDTLGVHPSPLRRWADTGRVPCRRTPGGHRRFSLSRITPILEEDNRRPARESRPVVDEQPWHDRFVAAGLVDDLRAIGQRLGGLVVQYVVRGEDDSRHLDEGHSLGREYAERSMAAGIDLMDATQAFLYYRSSFADLARFAPGIDTTPHVQSRYDAFMSEVLLGLISGYQERRNGSR
jgi:excisionase family DNA binding protein